MGLRILLLVLVSVVSGCGERATPAVSGSWPLQAPIAGVGDRQSPGVRLPDDVRPLRYALDLTVVPDARDIAAAKLNGQPSQVARVNENVIGLSIGSAVATGRLSIELAFAGPIDREKSRGIYAEKEGEPGTPIPFSSRPTRAEPSHASISRTRSYRGG